MNDADLHLHTHHSDGTYTPADLVSTAAKTGLSIIAVTDHDTVEGCAEVGLLAARAGLGFLDGTEITAEFEGRELHILGYLFDPAHPGLLAELAQAQAIRQNRVREMVARLRARNVPLAEESVFRLADCRAPGRPHVARALVEGGFCASLDEAFERFLKKDRPAWVPKEKMSARRAVELIHAAGGVAVMAHPGLNRDDSLIAKLARLGLDGLECCHPKHSAAAAERYRRMASNLGLVATGGSDCHGRSKNRPTIGTVRIPVEWVEQLIARGRPRPAGSRAATARPDRNPIPMASAAPLAIRSA